MRPVAAAVAPPSRTVRIGRERGSVEIGPVPVAGADVRAADQDLADLVGAGGAAVLAEDLEVHAVGRTAHLHDAAGRAEGADSIRWLATRWASVIASQ